MIEKSDGEKRRKRVRSVASRVFKDCCVGKVVPEKASEVATPKLAPPPRECAITLPF